MLTRRACLGVAAAAFPVSLTRHASQGSRPSGIDGARLRARLERLSTFGRPPGGTFEAGVSRVAYSDADVAARAWLIDEMKTAGLSPRIDPAGNIFARWPAGPSVAPTIAPILFGSHIDCPMGMIFVPSLGGISHSPLERTAWDDCTHGAAVLLDAVLDVASSEKVD